MTEILKQIEEWEAQTRGMKHWKTINQESWNDGPFPVIEKLCQALRIAVEAMESQNYNWELDERCDSCRNNREHHKESQKAIVEISKILNEGCEK
jgi:hypothetical protein